MSIFLNLLRRILCRGEEDPRPYRQDDLGVTSLIRNRFQDPTTTTTDYTQISSYDPLPRTISPANSTSFINQLNVHTTTRIQSPISSVASNFPNTSATPSAVAKPKTETPKPPPPPPPPRPYLSLASSSSSSSFGTPQLSIKPSLSQALLNPTIPQTKSNYIWVEKANLPNTSTKPRIETPKTHPQPQVSVANSTTPSAVAKHRIETPKRQPQPQVSVANSTTTPSAVAKHRIETPKRQPQPQVSVANSTTTPSAVAKPKTETPKRTPHQVLDAYSTTDQKLTHKSSPKPPPPRPDLSLASSSSSSSFGTPQLSIKSILSQAQLNPTIPQTKSNYIWVEKANFPNTSITPSAVAKPRIETPKTHPQPQVSVDNSKTPSVAKPKTETPKSSPNPPPSRPDSSLASSLSSSSFGTPQLFIKPVLSQAPLNLTLPQTKSNYVWVEKGATPLYMIPKDIKGLIQKDIVPDVLNKPLSPSTYIDYFDALLYAENYYLEKWDGFEMKDVSLQLHKAAIYDWRSKNKHLNRSDEKDDKIFVAFETDSVPERRPFLLSRDFASVRPSGRKVEPFQGIIYRVLKNSNLVLVEFGEDFHSQHYSSCKYDVKFSFNRVCLKRAHQAIAAVSDVLLRKFLFPEQLPKIYPIQTQVFVNHKLDTEQANAVRYILRLQDPPPYLVEGPLSVTNTKELSRTGVVVREAVLHICRTTPSSRILICAPLNSTCDMLMRSLQKEIPESDMFRANAAFREVDGVPIDILPSCLYKGECFSCPSLKELKKYKVILSTFMSSFRLHDEGIVAGHFSHIFLVDASCATEPETMVPLANLANERTAVVITGAPKSCSGWIRSNIARQNGLMRSYFERLCESKAYKSLDPNYITQLKDA